MAASFSAASVFSIVETSAAGGTGLTITQTSANTLELMGSAVTSLNGSGASVLDITLDQAVSQIDISMPSDNSSLMLADINLPDAAVKIAVSGGDHTFQAMGVTLKSFSWTASPRSTESDAVTLTSDTIPQIQISQGNGPSTATLSGITGNLSTTITQGDADGDAVGLQANCALGVTTLTQGDGAADSMTLDRTRALSLSAAQGNGAGDVLLLGNGIVGGDDALAGGMAGTGSVVLIQGSGNGDYIGVGNLIAGVVTLIQQDVATNTVGDTVGGVATSGIPSLGMGLDTASGLTPANNLDPSFLVPTDGFTNSIIEQLNITQGSAPGDLIALLQLQQGDGISIPPATVSETLLVTGVPFTPGGPIVPGTITILQQDLAGNSGDIILLGSYTGSYNAPMATGSITATNEVVSQGVAFGDVLSVLFNTETAPIVALNSVFAQGNGGDVAFFQENTAMSGGLFNYTGGSGGNYVQADSNFAIGAFDGGASSAVNLLGVDLNNSGIQFVDFDFLIFA
jgi:hypothetical protein